MRTLEHSVGSPPRPKQSDVARAAGVSASTVSKVINGGPGISAEVRSRVLQAIKEIGYTVNDTKQSTANGAKRVKLVTFYQFLTRDGSYFHAEILSSILSECEKHGIEIETILLNRDLPNDINDYNVSLNASPADAAIFVGIDAADYLKPVQGMGLPAVVVNGMDMDMRFDCVSPGSRDGSRLATRYLIELGHREIVHVTHLYRSFIRRRLDGFRDALEEAGIPFDPDRHIINIDQGYFSAEKAAEVIYKRVTEGSLKATALFCVSDYTAFGVVQGIQRAGRSVPGDYSVASFDDLPLSQLCTPAITSVGIDRTALGRLAVQRLVERLQDPNGPILRIEVGARLTVRESTRRIKSD